MRKMLPSPAMAVALLALVIAMGSTTYAAVKLKKNSVGAKQLKADAVIKAKIADAAVGTAEIVDGAVTAAKIADAAVGTAGIVDGAVTAAKIADAAVGTAEIVDGAVTAAKIADAAVDSGKIADATVTRADAARGTLVTAYARINNPPGNDNAAIAPGSAVNVPDIDVINESLGNFIVTFNGLPGDSLATCTITGQPVFSNATLAQLPKTTTMIATGGGALSASSAQLQTLNQSGAGVESDFYVQVSCPPG